MFYFIFHGLSHSDKNCEEIVKAFMDAVISKDPCSSTEHDYLPLIKLTNQTMPCDQVTGASY